MKEKEKNKIYKEVRKIKKGQISTYKKIADKLNLHPRTIAAALKQNYNKNIPCHRVIMSDGKLGGYNRGIRKKRALLKRERAA